MIKTLTSDLPLHHHLLLPLLLRNVRQPRTAELIRAQLDTGSV